MFFQFVTSDSKQRRKPQRASSRDPRRKTQPITAGNGRQPRRTSQSLRKSPIRNKTFHVTTLIFRNITARLKVTKKPLSFPWPSPTLRRCLASFHPAAPCSELLPVARRSPSTSCGFIATSSRRLIPYLPRRARVAYCHHANLRRSYSAAPPRSPVRIRTTSSTGETKILPSPTLPVRHVSTITSIKRSV